MACMPSPPLRLMSSEKLARTRSCASTDIVFSSKSSGAVGSGAGCLFPPMSLTRALAAAKAPWSSFSRSRCRSSRLSWVSCSRPRFRSQARAISRSHSDCRAPLPAGSRDPKLLEPSSPVGSARGLLAALAGSAGGTRPLANLHSEITSRSSAPEPWVGLAPSAPLGAAASASSTSSAVSVGFSRLRRFLLGLLGLGASHALHLRAEPAFSSVHVSHVHCSSAAGGARFVSDTGVAKDFGSAAGTGEVSRSCLVRGGFSSFPMKSERGGEGTAVKRYCEISISSNSSSMSTSGYKERTRLSKLSSRRRARRVAMGARHVGHSLRPSRMADSMHSLQNRCKHSVAVAARMSPRQIGHDRYRSIVSGPLISTRVMCFELIIISCGFCRTSSSSTPEKSSSEPILAARPSRAHREGRKIRVVASLCVCGEEILGRY